MKLVHPIIAASLLGCVCLAGCASEKSANATEKTTHQIQALEYVLGLRDTL